MFFQNKPVPSSLLVTEDAPPPKTPWEALLGWIRSFLDHFDWMMIVPMLLLLGIGLLFVYGTGQQVGGVHAEVFWKRQLTYIGIGIGFWFLLTFLDYRLFGWFALALYPITLILLILVLVMGETHFGAKRWLDVAGVSLQPSELAKLAILLLASWILAQRKKINRVITGLLVILVTVIPFVLILKEPDLGTSLVLIPIVAMISFTAMLKWRYIILLVVAAAILMPAGYALLKPYQKERILVFLNPERDPMDRGWNQLQAEMAVGNGGLTGKGFMKGTHCTLGYLPQTVANSDFIFPVIAEETGLVGTLSILFLYAMLFFAILRTAILADDSFGRYLCVGVAGILLMHTFINIGMCIRIAPVTGLPLPLVSYGGTFMLATMTYLGIVQSVYAHRNQKSIFSN